jgi:glycosyltransferase involved in cell wall biosynthesis
VRALADSRGVHTILKQSGPDADGVRVKNPCPRVTLAITTWNGEAFLREAIESCLAQTYDDLEVLVVDDGSTDGTRALLAELADDRLRIVRHETNQGIAAAYNTVVREARGELIARLGHDDVALPDRIAREVAVFDRHPDTDIVHGDAVVIDGTGCTTGAWRALEYPRRQLIHRLVRHSNFIVDPSTLIHRRVYDAIGDYSSAYPMCNDFDLWLRAVRNHRFRHIGGEPLILYRRHGGNFSDESNRPQELAEVAAALRERLVGWPLDELVPELDWPLLPRPVAERRARLVLAAAFEARGLPELAAEYRATAEQTPAAPWRPGRKPSGRRILLSSFGFSDAGGGTIVPRYVAKELAQRGHDVTVFAAGVEPLEGAPAYALRTIVDDGVEVVSVHNRPHGLLDLGHPHRELDDPAIRVAFADVLDRVQPDIVHLHNLHNLGLSLVDETFSRGIRTVFSTHNYWLGCARNYLFNGELELCDGPGDGGRACASCVGSRDAAGYTERRSELRERFSLRVDRILAVSEAMRRTLGGFGFPAEMIDVVHQAMPEDGAIWDALGRTRVPGRSGECLTVGFVGSAYPHKGPQLLIRAAQLTEREIRVRIHGEVMPAFAAKLMALDTRGVVELAGPFSHSELPGILAGLDAAVIPSLWWDCAPLVVAECLAGRVPVIGANMGGIPDLVEHERNGLLFEGRSAGALAAALDRLTSEPGLLERLQGGIEAPKAFRSYVDELEAIYAGEPAAASRSAAAPIAVRWVGDQSTASSLSTINREVGERLRADHPGIALERRATDRPIGDAPTPHTPEVEVRHQWPPDLSRPAGGRLALIQPWEFGSLPESWQTGLQEDVDEVWVPSEFVREMYLAAGVEHDRVHVVPNGVDLDELSPEGPRAELPDAVLRLLFVGGTISRKGADVLLAAYDEAFAGRDDVLLVIKDLGGQSYYRGLTMSDALRERAASGALPRVHYLEDELSRSELAALYRACDVLVHPYRGEGFAMPVLEAMACGLPTVVTDGGPTDEFCPADTGWRIASEPRFLAERAIGNLETLDRPWMLEPDRTDLVRVLHEVAASPDELRRRGARARIAAERYSWDAIAAVYAERIASLARRAPRRGPAVEPLELTEAPPRVLLATPAWRGRDRLAELLRAWADAFSADAPVGLYLLADPEVDGTPEHWESHVLAAADEAGVDLSACADVAVLDHSMHGRDAERVHAAAGGFVALHPACGGHLRVARARGVRIVEPNAVSLLAWDAGLSETSNAVADPRLTVTRSGD